MNRILNVPVSTKVPQTSFVFAQLDLRRKKRKKVCVVCVDPPFAGNGAASTSLDINFSVFMNLRCGS